MTGPDPADFGWWLASRAAGVVALLCITISVAVGLAMAGRVSRRPALARTLMAIHQQTALAGLVAIAVHAVTLLGDKHLSPSLGDLALPFTSRHEPLWTGLGVTGGWLASILGLTYWIRQWIGAQLWRRLHRATALVYVLTVAHTLGAGTDASEPWMRTLLLVTGAPVLFLFLMRVLTPRAAPAFRRFRVADVRPESSTVLSFDLVPADRRRVAPGEAGQFVTVRVAPDGGRPELRSYSLSRAPSPAGYRISVKREPGGRVSGHLHAAVERGDVVELGAPRGTFALGEPSDRPVALISAGIGVTPVLAMLGVLADRADDHDVWWIHVARNGSEHAFRGEAAALLHRLPRGHRHVRYTRPDPRDRLGTDFDAAGRPTADELLSLGVSADADVRLCGPTGFVADLTEGLVVAGVARERIRSESFGGDPAPAAGGTAPAAPTAAPVAGGPAVSFSRSGVTTAWAPGSGSLLDVAEANGVPVTPGCRVGACHGCRAGVLAGAVRHDPEPLEAPAPGSALLCCAVPEGDVVLDA